MISPGWKVRDATAARPHSPPRTSITLYGQSPITLVVFLVDGRVLVDASIGYRFPAEWGGFSIEGSVTNLTDKRYIATVGTGGFVASDPQGTFQTLLTGAPRQWFVTLKKGF